MQNEEEDDDGSVKEPRSSSLIAQLLCIHCRTFSILLITDAFCFKIMVIPFIILIYIYIVYFTAAWFFNRSIIIFLLILHKLTGKFNSHKFIVMSFAFVFKRLSLFC